MVEVESAQEALLATEDTTGSFQITIEDSGPKVKVYRMGQAFANSNSLLCKRL
jgi:hypothetical protein